MTPLETANDVQGQEVSATLDLTDGQAAQPAPASSSGREVAKRRSTSTPAGARTVVMAAGPSGGAGSCSATPLAPSSAWGAGGQTGDFTWSYPLRVPPGVAGPEPDLASATRPAQWTDDVVDEQPAVLGRRGAGPRPGVRRASYVACARTCRRPTTPSRPATCAGRPTTPRWVRRTLRSWSRTPRQAGSSRTTTAADRRGPRLQRRQRRRVLDAHHDRRHAVLLRPGQADGPTRGRPTRLVCRCSATRRRALPAATFAASSASRRGAGTSTTSSTPRQHDDLLLRRETNSYGRNQQRCLELRPRRLPHPDRVRRARRHRARPALAPPRSPSPSPSGACRGQITCRSQLTSANATPGRTCRSTRSAPSATLPGPVVADLLQPQAADVTTFTTTGSTSSAVDAWVLVHQFPDPGDGTARRCGWSASRTPAAGGKAARIFLPRTTSSPSSCRTASTAGHAPPLNGASRRSATRAVAGRRQLLRQDCPHLEPASRSPTPGAASRSTSPPWATTPTLHYFHKYVATSVSRPTSPGGARHTQ